MDLRRIGLVLGAVALVAACGSSAKTGAGGTTTSTLEVLPTGAIGAADLKGALLDPSDLGADGFTATSFTPPDVALPCADGSKSFEASYPPAASAFTLMTNGDGIFVREELRSYADKAAAAAALAAYNAGLKCTDDVDATWWTGGAGTMTISTSDALVDGVRSHPLLGKGIGGVVDTTSKGAVVQVIWYGTPDAADPLTLGDVNAIDQKALAKVK
jgi:hypothetical protein